MTALLVVPVLINAPLAQFLKVQSILSTPAFVLTAVLALMLAPLARLPRVNKIQRPHLTH